MIIIWPVLYYNQVLEAEGESVCVECVWSVCFKVGGGGVEHLKPF